MGISCEGVVGLMRPNYLLIERLRDGEPELQAPATGFTFYHTVRPSPKRASLPSPGPARHGAPSPSCNKQLVGYDLPYQHCRVKWKLSNWLFIIVAIGMVSAEEDGSQAPGYLEGLQALTGKRIPMKKVAAQRCSIDAVLTASPHVGADMIVHANKTLIDYISKNPEGVAFPVGSVLLKEKFPAETPDSSAILTTRMERVAMAGTVNDWKFSATSLEHGVPTVTSEDQSRCVVCHEDFEETSFVSPDSLKLLREYIKGAPGQ